MSYQGISPRYIPPGHSFPLPRYFPLSHFPPVIPPPYYKEIAQWVHPMKDRSNDPSHHERTLLPKKKKRKKEKE